MESPAEPSESCWVSAALERSAETAGSAAGDDSDDAEGSAAELGADSSCKETKVTPREGMCASSAEVEYLLEISY